MNTNYNTGRNYGAPGFAPKKGISKANIIWICVGITLLFLLFGTCSTYNSVQKSSVAVDEAWGNVQTQYQRRLDLIPNLVNTVKGAAAHETDVQKGTAEVRSGAVGEYEKAEKELLDATEQAKGTFSGPDGKDAVSPAKYSRLDNAYGIYVNAVHEAYPQVTATDAYKDLMAELAGTENRINTARMRYNETVKSYNLGIVTFPRNLVAGVFGFQPKQMFQAESAAAKAPTVDFE